MSPAVPKPEPRVKAARKPLKRGSSLKAGKPLAKVNPERQARVKKIRVKASRSPENKAAKQLAWNRCQGHCECGCGRPFDYDEGPKGIGREEFHHTKYDPPVGVYLRRECHAFLETTKFWYRHTRR